MRRLNEESLEALIVGQMVDDGWAEGKPADYVASYSLDLGQFTEFIEATQPDLVEPLGLTSDTPTRHKFHAPWRCAYAAQRHRPPRSAC